MTVFSVLRYPITPAFEADHLALLPRHIREGWWAEVIEWHRRRGRMIYNIPPEPARISSYINNHIDKHSKARHLQVLQRAIFRIDE